jgi:hypothetical protein
MSFLANPGTSAQGSAGDKSAKGSALSAALTPKDIVPQGAASLDIKLHHQSSGGFPVNPGGNSGGMMPIPTSNSTPNWMLERH